MAFRAGSPSSVWAVPRSPGTWWRKPSRDLVLRRWVRDALVEKSLQFLKSKFKSTCSLNESERCIMGLRLSQNLVFSV